jgi:23S rRNA (uracil1939-C5)-methyltransferase
LNGHYTVPVAADADILVEITSLAPGGDGVGRQQGGEHDGRVTFVALTASGDRVRVKLVRQKSRVAWGEVVSFEARSTLRVQPPCPLFGRCGGCQWQHVDAVEQRRQKGAIVSRALGIEVGPAEAVGPAFGYRERARLAAGFDENGAPALGFRARRSHAIVDVPACPLLAPPAAAALPVLRQLAVDRELSPGDELVLQAGRGPAGEEVVARLGSQGVRLAVRDDGVAAVETSGDAGHETAAEAALVDVSESGGQPLRIPAGAFAQVGRAANAALVAAVAQALGPRPGQVLELHAGSGNFTRMLVSRAASVIASEADPRAVERGRQNVPQADWRPAAALPDRLPVDTVLVDPPREGLDARHLTLAAGARGRLVYVSCDPQTLARDAARLRADGWRVQGARAFDLMPQTHHVEVVAWFTRDVGASAP